VTVLRPVVYDTECYRNYWLAAFKCVETGRITTFELGLGRTFDRERLRTIMRNNLTVGFNSNHYDNVLTWMAIQGASTQRLKQASDDIIVRNCRSWDIEKLYELPRLPKWNHVDLIEVAPGTASLKIYGGRLHAPLMQDLPIEPDAELTEEDVARLKPYCINDLSTTELLMKGLKQQIELREVMSREYEEDLRSKSDAQVAEAVIKSQINKRKGQAIERPSIRPGTEFHYRPPAYLQFRSQQLRDILAECAERPFIVGNNGAPLPQPFLEDAKVRIGSSVYRMGIGGLHSSEQRASHVADADTLLLDRDVASYYPAIILTLGLAPKHIGNDFLEVYRGIVNRRLTAKRAGDKSTADSLKIAVNGSFGKLGSKWSVLYSPDLLIQVTLTGQLALLMLIERLEDAGIPCVSGNTDGVVIKCPKALEATMLDIVATWERETGFETEETRYTAVYSRDVNNYLAVKPDGKVKAKGAYAETGLQKNPRNEICLKAVQDRITKGVPLDTTIRGCLDIKQFVTVQAVKGGATKDGVYLGKAIRWFYARGETGAIHYKTPNRSGNFNKVPRTDGARPIMNLPDTFPDDVDYDWYVREAEDILREIGFFAPLPELKRVKLKPLAALAYAVAI
jgi:hypothetical protein